MGGGPLLRTFRQGPVHHSNTQRMGDIAEEMDELVSPVAMFESEVINLFKRVFGLVETISKDEKALEKLRKVFDPLSLICLTFFITMHKPMLHRLYSLTATMMKKAHAGATARLQSAPGTSTTSLGSPFQVIEKYEGSLIYHLESGIEAGIYSFAMIYVIDFLLVIYAGLGLHHSIDITGIASSVLARVVLGLFVTRSKDWVLMRRRIFESKTKSGIDRDPRREDVVNELTSTLIWLIIGMGFIERLANDLKVSVSSIFAFGGIGSATLVIALKSVFENFVGGIMLRIQDKFRVGDKIQTSHDEGGWVQKVNAFSTVIRREDDTSVVIPNSVFIHDIVINWSRTPYRRFRTEVAIPLKQVEKIPICIKSIKERVEKVEGLVTKQERDLLVTAAKFTSPPDGNTEDQEINIVVDAHIYKKSQAELSVVKTNIVREIGLALRDSTVNMF